MHIHTIWAQRKQRYSGQFSPELLGAIDENGNMDNPDYILDDLEKFESMVRQGIEFESVAHVVLDLPELTWQKIEQALQPSTVKSSVSVKAL